MTAAQSKWHRSLTDHLISKMGLTPQHVERFKGSDSFYDRSVIRDVVAMLPPVVWSLLANSTTTSTSADTAKALKTLCVPITDSYALSLQRYAAEAALLVLLQDRVDSLDLDCATTEIHPTLIAPEQDRVTREWQPWMRDLATDLISRFGLNAQNSGYEPDPAARFFGRYKPLSPEATETIKSEALSLRADEVEQLGWLTMSGNTAAFQEALVALDIDLSRCDIVELYRAAASGVLFLCVMRFVPRT